MYIHRLVHKHDFQPERQVLVSLSPCAHTHACMHAFTCMYQSSKFKALLNDPVTDKYLQM